MADSSLFGGLSKGALAALPYITGLVSEGQQSASQILSSVRSAGFSIRTQTLYDIVASLQQRASIQQAVRVQDQQAVIPDSAHRAPASNTLRTYSYKVLLKTRDPETGETGSRFVTVSTNTAMSPDNIKAVAQSIGTNRAAGYEEEVTSAAITDATFSPEEGM